MSTTQTSSSAKERISKARTLLMIEEQPFFGTLLLSLDIIEDETIPTACTNGYEIRYSPKFIEWLASINEIKGVLLHEVLHIVLDHCSRLKNRDLDRWNIAADLAVCHMIRSDYIPKGCITDPKNVYADMTVEQIYDKLPENLGKPEMLYGNVTTDKTGKVFKNGKLIGYLEPMPNNPEKKAEVQGKIMEAFEATKNKGDLPGGLKRYINDLYESKINWASIVQMLMGNILTKDDYTFYPCNRRYIKDNMYLPSNYSTKVERIVICIDTSGSITKEHIKNFAGQVKCIKQYVDIVEVITCDAQVHEDVEVTSFEEFCKTVKLTGGGGTDFRPAFEKIQKNNTIPDLLIYLTDGYGTYPNERHLYPVIWLITDNGLSEKDVRVSVPENEHVIKM